MVESDSGKPSGFLDKFLAAGGQVAGDVKAKKLGLAVLLSWPDNRFDQGTFAAA
jgi:hypothetical protein